MRFGVIFSDFVLYIGQCYISSKYVLGNEGFFGIERLCGFSYVIVNLLVFFVVVYSYLVVVICGNNLIRFERKKENF